MPVKSSPVDARVACIGAGYWGRNLVRVFHQLGVLSAVCDHDQERTASLREAYPDVPSSRTWQDILGDDTIDAVIIATLAATHYALAREALYAGKDVFVEKPLCLSATEAEELVSLADENRRVLMVGHVLWYHPAILKLRECVVRGDLGNIQYIYSNRLNLGKIRREENILWSFAPHDISVILGLLEEMPIQIQAQAGYYLSNDVADVTMSLLEFSNGRRAHIFVSWLHPFKEQKLVVIGDKKMAVFDDCQTENKLLLYPHTIEWKGEVPEANRAEAEPVSYEWEEPLVAECRHFLECIRSRTPPRTDGREGLRVLRVLERCQEKIEVLATATSL